MNRPLHPIGTEREVAHRIASLPADEARDALVEYRDALIAGLVDDMLQCTLSLGGNNAGELERRLKGYLTLGTGEKVERGGVVAKLIRAADWNAPHAISEDPLGR
jgi:hypothetical protein